MLDRTPFDIAPDASWCALARGPETIDLWPLAPTDAPGEAQPPVHTVQTARSKLQGLAFIGGGRLLTVHQMGEIAVWQLGNQGSGGSREPAWSVDTPLEPCAFAVDRDGSTTRVAVGDRRGRLLVVHLSARQAPTARLTRAHNSDLVSLAFGPGGARLATSGRDRMIRIWSLRAPEDADATPLADLDFRNPPDGPPLRRTLPGSQGWPLALSFNPAGDRLASGCMDNGLYLWTPDADSPLSATAHLHHNWVVDTAFSPDGARVATGSWDATAAVFATDGLEAQYRLDLHEDFVSAVAFTPTSGRLVTAGYDGKLGVWNLQEGRLETEIAAHPYWIEQMVVIADDRAVSVSSDDCVKLWSLGDGRCLATFGENQQTFELGRDVDFSAFVDDANLPQMETDARSEASIGDTVVRELEGDAGKMIDGEGDAQTAVGMLEQALESAETTSLDATDTEDGPKRPDPEAGANAPVPGEGPAETVSAKPEQTKPAGTPSTEPNQADAPPAHDSPDTAPGASTTETPSAESDARAGEGNVDLDDAFDAPELNVEANADPEEALEEDLELADNTDTPAESTDTSLQEDLDLAGTTEPQASPAASLQKDLEMASSPDGPGSSPDKSVEEDLDLAGGNDTPDASPEKSLEEDLNLAGTEASDSASTGAAGGGATDSNLPDPAPNDDTGSGTSEDETTNRLRDKLSRLREQRNQTDENGE